MPGDIVIKTEVYNSFEQLKSIQPQWDEFVESVSGDIFMTYDWCRIWWKYYGKNRKLKVFVFRDDNKIIGMIPLFFEKIWLGPVFVRVAKIVGSDFTLTQFSIPLAKNYLQAIIKKISEVLFIDKLDILHLGPIAGLYEHYDDLKIAFEELLSHSHLVMSDNKVVQTYFILADNWEKQLTSLKKGERWDIKRSYKALCTDTTPLISNCASSENFKQMFENFVNMHQSSWQSLGMLGHFDDWPAAEAFHSDVAETQLKHNRLRLLQVKSGKIDVGYEYVYKFGDRYFEFLNARSKSGDFAKISVGKVVFSELVKKALNESVKCIDSMRGRYEHKLKLGGSLFPTKNLYVIPRKPYSIFRVRLFRAFACFLNLAYYKLWYSRVASRLPFKKKCLWKIWIRTCNLS